MSPSWTLARVACDDRRMPVKIPPPQPIDCLLFDLDGTLVDACPDIASALDAALASHGLDTLGREPVPAMIGDGARTLVVRALARVGAEDADVDEVLATYLEAYRARHLDATALYPGVRETLEALAARGVACAVVTNKPHEFSVSLLEHLGAAQLVRAVVGGDSSPELKPSPVPLRLALDACGATPERSAMVGDGEPDMRGATEAGIYPIAVGYGYRSLETLEAAGALASIASFRDLLDLVG
jgi:phosphoglycolate phosphatase